MGQHWRSLPLGQKTLVMGVINMTPDSVRGDGFGYDVVRAVAHAQEMVAAGADLLDVGGESTRPGAMPVDEAEELRRIVPCLAALRDAVPVPLSIDTMKSGVAREALKLGVSIVNDVSGLRADPAMDSVVATGDAAVIVGHWARWGPGALASEHGVTPVVTALRAAAHALQEQGVAKARIWLDPGLGFGKSPATSLALLRGLGDLVSLGYPVVVGPSGKGFARGGGNGPGAEDWPSVAALVALAIARGAQVVRVHDLHRLGRVAKMADAVVRRSSG